MLITVMACPLGMAIQGNGTSYKDWRRGEKELKS